jgi:hypothetical protein
MPKNDLSTLDTLERLYIRRETLINGDSHGAGWSAHAAILDRLVANQRVAQSIGWTSCAIERANGIGRFRAWGVPPGASSRRQIPDWSADI